MSGVGDLEAMATETPFSSSAYNMPLASRYSEGISRLERHSLTNQLEVNTNDRDMFGPEKSHQSV